jgi:hypothetical protein
VRGEGGGERVGVSARGVSASAGFHRFGYFAGETSRDGLPSVPDMGPM